MSLNINLHNNLMILEFIIFERKNKHLCCKSNTNKKICVNTQRNAKCFKVGQPLHFFEYVFFYFYIINQFNH